MKGLKPCATLLSSSSSRSLHLPRGSAQSAGIAVRPSFAVDIDAWPFAFGFEGGAWLDHWPWLGGVHVRVGAIRKQYEAQVSRDYGALMGSYGAQIDSPFSSTSSPIRAVGYERLGTVLFDAEGAGPNGRTQQALTGEVVCASRRLPGSSSCGVRGSLPIATGPTRWVRPSRRSGRANDPVLAARGHRGSRRFSFAPCGAHNAGRAGALQHFAQELARRRVLRVLIAYVVAVFGALQGLDIMSRAWSFPASGCDGGAAGAGGSAGGCGAVLDLRLDQGRRGPHAARFARAAAASSRDYGRAHAVDRRAGLARHSRYRYQDRAHHLDEAIHLADGAS